MAEKVGFEPREIAAINNLRHFGNAQSSRITQNLPSWGDGVTYVLVLDNNMLFTHDFGDMGSIPVIYDRSRSTNHSQYSCLIQPHDPTIAKPLIYEAVGRSIYMENNTEVQTADPARRRGHLL